MSMHVPSKFPYRNGERSHLISFSKPSLCFSMVCTITFIKLITENKNEQKVLCLFILANPFVLWDLIGTEELKIWDLQSPSGPLLVCPSVALSLLFSLFLFHLCTSLSQLGGRAVLISFCLIIKCKERPL